MASERLWAWTGRLAARANGSRVEKRRRMFLASFSLILRSGNFTGIALDQASESVNSLTLNDLKNAGKYQSDSINLIV
ncbi:hypothetical protein D3C80_1792580 [compost metagenome]